MTILNCLIVETADRPLPLLEEYIARVPYLRLVHRFRGDMALASSVSHQQVHLLFCDMELANEKAVHLLKQAHPQSLLVCIATRQEFEAGNGDLDIFSILYRPFSFERFLSTVIMARKYLQLARSFSGGGDRNFIFIKSEYKIIKVKFDEIIFCEGMKDYTQIYLKGKGTPILTLQNLKSFYGKLPPADFVRVHRSYVVSLASIDTIARNEISIGKKIIPIGESFREHFFHIVQYHS